MRSALRVADRGIAQAERFLLLGMVAVMLLLIVGQILLRWVGVSLAWPDELARFLMLWVAILGASLATRARAHITIDVLTRLFSTRGRAIAALISAGTAILVCGFLFLVGVYYVHAEYVQYADRAVALAYRSRALGIPFWVLKLILPIGLFVVTFRFFRIFLDDAVRLRTGDLKRFEPRLPAEIEGKNVGEED